MILLWIDVMALLFIADRVGQRDINWVLGIILCGVLWLNAIAMFRRVFG